MPQDAVLEKDTYYDFSLDDEGQIVVDDFFDTAILYSILGEQRAVDSEVQQIFRQRGWIGNENTDYENGSKIWIYHQSRVTRTVLNNIGNEAVKALQWLVRDKFAIAISDPIVEPTKTGMNLTVTIQRSGGSVVNKTVELWDNTGIR